MSPGEVVSYERGTPVTPGEVVSYERGTPASPVSLSRRETLNNKPRSAFCVFILLVSLLSRAIGATGAWLLQWLK